MVGDEIEGGEKFARPRLSEEELWMLYRLVDSRYWYLRKQPQFFQNLRKVSRLRLKLMRNLNRNRKPESKLSVRRRVY